GFVSELMTANPRSEKARSTFTLPDTMIVRAGYNGDGGYSAVCSDRLLFFDKDDNKLADVSYEGSIPTNFLISDKYTAIVFNENAVGSRSNIIIYTNDGNEQYSCGLDGRIIDIKADEKYVYILFEDSIARIDPTAGRVDRANLESGCLALVLKDHEVVLVCYTNRASAYSIDALLEEQRKAENEAEDEADGTEATEPEASENETEAVTSPPETSPPETAAEESETENQP
nr:hypothetical protein [Clostridia bacterium]